MVAIADDAVVERVIAVSECYVGPVGVDDGEQASSNDTTAIKMKTYFIMIFPLM
jgi:hypothetical protein